jgi:serine/threonine protein kinase
MNYYNNLVGKTLGNYQLVELIGQGGMSAVYRAYQPKVGRNVAVKILYRSLALDPTVNARFNREAQVIAHLEHPHIVPLYDFGQEGDIIYLAIRYLDGGTLSDRLRSGELPSLAETARLLTQLAPALDYAHSQGVIHRDIKPSNILFDGRGNPYLADFGIAGLTQAANDITGEGIVGTPYYMSPEQFRGDQIGLYTDLYALGTTIFETITGQPPFQGDSLPELFYKILNQPAARVTDFRPDLPPAINEVLGKALEKDPKARFSSAAEFAQAFEKAISGVQETRTSFFTRPVPARAPTFGMDTSPTFTGFPVRASAPPAKRAPILTRWLVAAVIGLVVISGVVFLLNAFDASTGLGLAVQGVTPVLVPVLAVLAVGALSYLNLSLICSRKTTALHTFLSLTGLIPPGDYIQE